MILFPGSTLLAGPKHSTSVPFSAGVAMPLSVDEKVFSNLLPDLAIKALPGPQIEEDIDLCDRGHSLFPFTLQVVTPLMSPLTIHVKLNAVSGQLRGAAVNCPVTSPE